jgi:hypothetical protein
VGVAAQVVSEALRITERDHEVEAKAPEATRLSM